MYSHEKVSPVRALFLFHLKVGIRISLRVFVPIIAIIFILYYFLRPEFFLMLAFEFFGKPGSMIPGFLAFFLCVLAALQISPRILSGLGGWIRHLPISGVTHRRMAVISIFISLFPILCVFFFLMTVLHSSQGKVDAVAFAGFILLGLAVSLAVLPVKKKTRVFFLSAGSALLGVSGSGLFFLLGIMLFILTDFLAGSFYFRRDKKNLRTSPESFFLPIVSWRALGFHLIPPYLYSIGILSLSYLFLANNNFSLLLSQKIFTGTGTLSLVIFFVFLSGRLGYRRPLWPWARSLSWSARQRILGDTFFLGLHALPLLVVISITAGRIPVVLIGCLPMLSTLAAWSVTPRQGSRFGSAGKMLPLGIILALLLMLTAWSSLFCLPGFFIILNLAADEEKNLKVTRWQERYHFAAGDPQSWSPQ